MNRAMCFKICLVLGFFFANSIRAVSENLQLMDKHGPHEIRLEHGKKLTVQSYILPNGYNKELNDKMATEWDAIETKKKAGLGGLLGFVDPIQKKYLQKVVKKFEKTGTFFDYIVFMDMSTVSFRSVYENDFLEPIEHRILLTIFDLPELKDILEKHSLEYINFVIKNHLKNKPKNLLFVYTEELRNKANSNIK